MHAALAAAYGAGFIQASMRLVYLVRSAIALTAAEDQPNLEHRGCCLATEPLNLGRSEEQPRQGR
jgi:hypothetical protein